MCVRASYMKLTRDTHLMQQFIYYYKQLYMFRASICPSSGVLDCILLLNHMAAVVLYNLLLVFLYACAPLACLAQTNLMYVCPCIINEIDERYPLDATIYLLLLTTLHVSGIYMPIFRSIWLCTFVEPYGSSSSIDARNM